MTESYKPPFTISSAILSLVATICEKLGRLSVLDHEAELRLRRINKIKTVQGSLAIEGNTLDEDQISALLDGKIVIAPAHEIQEAHNAIKAYDLLGAWRPNSESSLLKAHDVLMQGLLDAPGSYRNKGVGVTNGNDVVHFAPPADRVPYLMKELFSWLNKTDIHPLIASSVFHYEFEFIHPFTDGNGRMGRLWQTAILNQWNPLFTNLPVGNMIYKSQQAYYSALNESTAKGSCDAFIEFMLNVINETIENDQDSDQVSDQVSKLLFTMSDSSYKALELMEKLKLSHRPTFRKNYLTPTLKSGLIERTIPDKPNSKLQKYRLTTKGKSYKSRNQE